MLLTPPSALTFPSFKMPSLINVGAPPPVRLLLPDTVQDPTPTFSSNGITLLLSVLKVNVLARVPLPAPPKVNPADVAPELITVPYKVMSPTFAMTEVFVAPTLNWMAPVKVAAVELLLKIAPLLFTPVPVIVSVPALV